MTRDDIIQKVKGLNLPAGGYVVFGSCPLAIAGLREANDIDMLVSDEVLASLKQAGWQQIDKGKDDKPLARDVFDVHNHWNFSTYSPTLEHLLETADIIEGVPFASLDEVRKWKIASGRPKDLRDIELIDSVKYIIKPSSIHGRGLFAKRKINKGETVVAWHPKQMTQEEAAQLPTDERAHYLYPQDDKLLWMQPPERYINHSCDPNTHVVDKCDVATRNIEAGEEITSDYLDVSTENFVCHCGAVSCRGVSA